MRSSCLSILALALAARAPLASPQGAAPAEERNVAIVLFPRVELLDFAGPAEAFATSHTRQGHGFHVYTVARTREPMSSLGVVQVTAEYTFGARRALAVRPWPPSAPTAGSS
jgi:transcriptional regulator GlxA family with amidase domain